MTIIITTTLPLFTIQISAIPMLLFSNQITIPISILKIKIGSSLSSPISKTAAKYIITMTVQKVIITILRIKTLMQIFLITQALKRQAR